MNEKTIAITAHQDAQATTGLLQIIEKFATDPSIDPLKLEKMLDMQERIFNKNAELAYNAAMSQVQSSLKPIFRNKRNDQTSSSFADFEQVWHAMNPLVTQNGFALSYGTDNSTIPGYIRIICDCSHIAGHSRRYFVDLPVDNMGIKGNANKTALHGVGSTMSYGRRYLAMLIFNVALTNEDNDGNAVPAEALITEDQLGELIQALSAKGISVEKACAKFRIQTLAELEAVRFPLALKAIQNTKEPK